MEMPNSLPADSPLTEYANQFEAQTPYEWMYQRDSGFIQEEEETAQKTQTVKKHHCPFQDCTKVYSQRSGLASHIRVHQGERPYACTVCEKAFVQKASLVKHLVIHTGDKKWQCEQCGKKFTRKTGLTYHMKLHSNDRPFKCDICGKSYVAKDILTKHLRYVHSSIFPAPAEGAVEEFSESTYHDSYQSNALMSMPNMTDFNHYQEPRDSQFMSQEMPQEMIDFIRQQNLTQDNQPIEFHHQE